MWLFIAFWEVYKLFWKGGWLFCFSMHKSEVLKERWQTSQTLSVINVHLPEIIKDLEPALSQYTLRIMGLLKQTSVEWDAGLSIQWPVNATREHAFLANLLSLYHTRLIGPMYPFNGANRRPHQPPCVSHTPLLWRTRPLSCSQDWEKSPLTPI